MAKKPSLRTKQSKARRIASQLLPPNSTPSPETPNRDTWISEICDTFVMPGDTNKAFYKLFLEQLWPVGHGIPGPHVNQEQIREAVDNYRILLGKKTYRDPFRRFRELQGEEGLKGVAKAGQTYQLINLDISEKRVPRIALSDEDWETILRRYDYGCANCKRRESEVRLQQNHKVPRVRADKTALLAGDVNVLDNWQPLCDECNNFKSTSCRNCRLDCFECPWAFPEKFKALRISPHNTARLLAHAQAIGIDPDELINRIVEEYVDSN